MLMPVCIYVYFSCEENGLQNIDFLSTITDKVNTFTTAEMQSLYVAKGNHRLTNVLMSRSCTWLAKLHYYTLTLVCVCNAKLSSNKCKLIYALGDRFDVKTNEGFSPIMKGTSKVATKITLYLGFILCQTIKGDILRIVTLQVLSQLCKLLYLFAILSCSFKLYTCYSPCWEIPDIVKRSRSITGWLRGYISKLINTLSCHLQSLCFDFHHDLKKESSQLLPSANVKA